MTDFGTNVDPKRFGAGSETPKPWTCICGVLNQKWYTRCHMCNVEKKVAREVNETK